MVECFEQSPSAGSGNRCGGLVSADATPSAIAAAGGHDVAGSWIWSSARSLRCDASMAGGGRTGCWIGLCRSGVGRSEALGRLRRGRRKRGQTVQRGASAVETGRRIVFALSPYRLAMSAVRHTAAAVRLFSAPFPFWSWSCSFELDIAAETTREPVVLSNRVARTLNS